MTTWVKDDNDNKCSVEYFGTVEAAQAALDSLKNCKNCTNCSDCSDCSRCSDCSGCSGCSDCSDCSRCSDCSGCSDCSRCSGCSDCSRCSDCSGCSHTAFLWEKKDVVAEPAEGDIPGTPPVPTIENINTKVYDAVSQPNALDMGTWHTCETTHCRGGWVVHLAGEPGRKLERFFGTALAAQLIYRESGSPINPCRFYDGNEEAMADMKRLAEAEAQS